MHDFSHSVSFIPHLDAVQHLKGFHRFKPIVLTAENTIALSKGKRKKGSNQGNGAEGERPYPTNRKGLPTTPSDRLNHALVFPSQDTTRNKLTMSSKAKNGTRTNGTSICNHTAGETAPTEIIGADLAAHSRLTTSISKALSRAHPPIRRTGTAATRL